jgi:hypothetical protein
LRKVPNKKMARHPKEFLLLTIQHISSKILVA